jgi:hypothetical protein
MYYVGKVGEVVLPRTSCYFLVFICHSLIAVRKHSNEGTELNLLDLSSSSSSYSLNFLLRCQPSGA